MNNPTLTGYSQLEPNKKKYVEHVNVNSILKYIKDDDTMRI